MIVRAKQSGIHPLLIPGKEYVVFEIDWESYRVQDDDPCLFEKEMFDVIDPTIPADWIRDEPEEGFYSTRPPKHSERCFWERWHDGDPEATAIFENYLKKIGLR